MKTPPSPPLSGARDPSPRLEQELNAALSRLRELGGAVVVEELLGAIGDNSPFADEVDDIQVTASREIDLATRSLLVERVNRLTAALRRLHRGEYGVCVECGAAVSAARLHVMPEAQTCLRCQETIERLGRQRASRSASAPRGDVHTTDDRGGAAPSSRHHLEEPREAGASRRLSGGR